MYIQHSNFWSHVKRLLADGYARNELCTSYMTGRHSPGILRPMSVR
ncbi:hypothetical protein UCMB321_1486 [Pseudomonas batumici]|uniref:Uncharacterized protein n=1 Tax=Pseudomonas batumici TaxID=226910 RepID=A0A0C2I6H3_9PSED|nr:hypothetical protein UCMB321_1486 [Pseudomonas batumici]